MLNLFGAVLDLFGAVLNLSGAVLNLLYRGGLGRC